MKFILILMLLIYAIPFIINIIIKKKYVAILNIALCVMVCFFTYIINGIVINAKAYTEFDSNIHTPILYFISTLIIEIVVLVGYLVNNDLKEEYSKFWVVGIILTILAGLYLIVFTGLFNSRVLVNENAYGSIISLEDLESYTKPLVRISDAFSVAAINIFTLFTFKNRKSFLNKQEK